MTVEQIGHTDDASHGATPSEDRLGPRLNDTKRKLCTDVLSLGGPRLASLGER